MNLKSITYILVAMLFAISKGVYASTIFSAESVVSSPSHLITGFDFTLTIDQSGLLTNYDSGITDFDSYIAGNPLHEGNYIPQTYSASGYYQATSLIPDIVYDLGSVYNLEQLAFWNYPYTDSAAITAFNVYTSIDEEFFSSNHVGYFRPTSDATLFSRLNQAQVFDLIDTQARYVRLDIVSTESINSVGFSEIAFDGTLTPVPLPAAIWLFSSGILGLLAIGRSVPWAYKKERRT